MPNAFSKNRLVAGASYPVENNAANVDLAVKLHTARHDGSHGARTLRTIYDEHHRCLQKLGELRCAGASFNVDAVIKASVSLDNCQVGR